MLLVAAHSRRLPRTFTVKWYLTLRRKLPCPKQWVTPNRSARAGQRPASSWRNRSAPFRAQPCPQRWSTRLGSRLWAGRATDPRRLGGHAQNAGVLYWSPWKLFSLQEQRRTRARKEAKPRCQLGPASTAGLERRVRAAGSSPRRWLQRPGQPGAPTLGPGCENLQAL